MQKLISLLMTLVLLSQLVPAVSARPKGDWNAVKALVKLSVAVKTKAGETHYGMVQSVDDSGIAVQIAGQDDFTSQEINFQRDTVAKVWRARLRFGETNITKAAWIGAGLGVGVGMAAAVIKGAAGSSDPPAGGHCIHSSAPALALSLEHSGRKSIKSRSWFTASEMFLLSSPPSPWSLHPAAHTWSKTIRLTCDTVRVSPIAIRSVTA
jgi:hypothetical protein